MTRGADAEEICANCRAPLAARQRYCLCCGERTGPRDAQLEQLVRRVRAPSAGPSRPPVADGVPAPTARPAPRNVSREGSPAALLAGLAQLTLPSRRVCAGLVLAFVAFGALLGASAGSRVDSTLAASARPAVKLLLPAQRATTAPDETGAAAGEPPETPAQSTPEALEPVSTPAPSHAPASTAPTSTPRQAGDKGTTPANPNRAAAKLPSIKHVFLIMLSDEPYAATFGPESKAPYLSRTLEKRGTLLARYYGVAHQQLADGIALLSGQGPTAATAANCPLYSDVAPATVGAEEQVAGDGCVYPATTATLAGQLEVKRLAWRAYVQGIAEGGVAEPACAHPALGQPDASSTQPSAQQYATWRNPFLYFQGLVESPSCAEDDVGLSALAGDLSASRRTPSLSYIVPDRCHDASPGPCPGGGPGGLAAADALLGQIVPKILASQAYKQGGLLLITTDQAPSSGELADSSSCCGQPRFANLPPATGIAASLPPEGGGQVGALLLSPFVKAHTISQEPYNHFSLLRTIEDLFALKHLGYAAGAHVNSFEPSLFAARPTRHISSAWRATRRR